MTNKPVLKISAVNTGEAISGNCSDLMGLYNVLYLCIGSKCMLTTNLCTKFGLTNGLICYVVDIIFSEQNDDVPGTLPTCVWVRIPNNQYTGPSFFPNDPTRSMWVPIKPIIANQTYYKNHVRVPSSRTMIPLKLSYAFTPWKVQGQTITGKIEF